MLKRRYLKMVELYQKVLLTIGETARWKNG